MFAYAGLLALLAGTAVVRADPVPTAPGPGDVFKQGGQCTFTWDADTTGQWKTMNVELMSGDNWNMIHITTVANLDGTDASKTTYSYDCPQVTPNSAIYFYQFTSPNAANRTWTTRFAIADANGNTTPPANSTQPDGQAIPWGVGNLVDPSSAVAAPSYLASGTTGSTGSTTSTTGSTSGSTGSTGSSAGASSGAGTSAAAPPASSAGSSAAPSSGAQSSAPPSGATTNTTTTTTTTTNSTGGAGSANGAMSAIAVDGYLVRAAGALGAAAFAFAVVL
ncbi:hypothetical protein FKP32DRAFT_1677236 [Trametes sanguinea]|nr:hypothetical protein FKP32DRAFT_1677236 [Trametes sanguinea]